ncbi:MAG: hypothetical protein H0T82_03950 [Sphingomonas sp.]|nr:hypothetical protein [Sphingomonas sp.]
MNLVIAQSPSPVSTMEEGGTFLQPVAALLSDCPADVNQRFQSRSDSLGFGVAAKTPGGQQAQQRREQIEA